MEIRYNFFGFYGYKNIFCDVIMFIKGFYYRYDYIQIYIYYFIDVKKDLYFLVFLLNFK